MFTLGLHFRVTYSVFCSAPDVLQLLIVDNVVHASNSLLSDAVNHILLALVGKRALLNHTFSYTTSS